MTWPESDIAGAVLPAAEGEVAVFHLVPTAADAERLLPYLTADERQRAARLRLDRARREFVAGRATLRRLLGRAMNRAPAELTIRAGEHGKPTVAGCPMAFNVAHADGAVLLAIGRVPGNSPALGVDLEAVRADVEVLELAERYFAPTERAVLQQLEEPERSAFFFRLWTAKEAVLKAHGGGLTLPLHAAVVDGTADRQSIGLPLPHGGTQTFAVQRLRIDRGWEAALAVEEVSREWQVAVPRVTRLRL